MSILKKMFFLCFCWLCFPYEPLEEFTSLSDCLVTQNIGIFKFDSKTARMGSASGIVGLTGHFQDHVDKICTGDYSNSDEVKGLSDEDAYEKIFTVTVQVTQHAGSDSDKWLLHEVEDGYRNSEDKDEGLGRFYGKLREINGQKVIYSGLGGGNFTWVSNKIVINIEYTDLYRQKPEPLEVVQAYLQKLPSSIPTTQVADKSHDELWLKDEMERRLWLSEKWFNQLDLQKAEVKTVLQEVVKHLDVFLKYREKYYSISAKSERNLLQNYLNQNNAASLKEKLKEYQVWWSKNKSENINLP